MAYCCRRCLGDLRKDAAKWTSVATSAATPPQELAAAQEKAVARCPQCREPIGESVAELGASVGAAPTFVLAL